MDVCVQSDCQETAISSVPNARNHVLDYFTFLPVVIYHCINVHRYVTVSDNVTVKLASDLLIVPSLEAEAVTIATQLRLIRRVSASTACL